MHILIIIVVALLILSGIIGSILPVIPGPLLILAGIFIYAWHTDFNTVTWSILLLLAFLVIASQILDWIASSVGAKKYGASRWGIIGALVGGTIGLFAGGIFGILAGPFLGALFFELIRGRGIHTSFKIGYGTFIGFLGGTAGRIIVSIIMTAIFFVTIMQ